MPCQLACIPPPRVAEIWPHVEQLIRAAIEKPRLDDFATVKHNLFNGGSLLWVAWNDSGVKAAAVTQIAIANGDKYCTICACGGRDSKEWLPLIRGLEVYAKQEMCRAMRIYGRRGWMRVLPDYKVVGYVLERTL
jgi:hypothetical protein